MLVPAVGDAHDRRHGEQVAAAALSHGRGRPRGRRGERRAGRCPAVCCHRSSLSSVQRHPVGDAGVRDRHVEPAVLPRAPGRRRRRRSGCRSRRAARTAPCRPRPSICMTRSAPCSGRMSVTTTWAPCRAKAFAVAAPIPIAPPVTSTTDSTPVPFPATGSGMQRSQTAIVAASTRPVHPVRSGRMVHLHNPVSARALRPSGPAAPLHRQRERGEVLRFGQRQPGDAFDGLQPVPHGVPVPKCEGGDLGHRAGTVDIGLECLEDGRLARDGAAPAAARGSPRPGPRPARGRPRPRSPTSWR